MYPTPAVSTTPLAFVSPVTAAFIDNIQQYEKIKHLYNYIPCDVVHAYRCITSSAMRSSGKEVDAAAFCIPVIMRLEASRGFSLQSTATACIVLAYIIHVFRSVARADKIDN